MDDEYPSQGEHPVHFNYQPLMDYDMGATCLSEFIKTLQDWLATYGDIAVRGRGRTRVPGDVGPIHFAVWFPLAKRA